MTDEYNNGDRDVRYSQNQFEHLQDKHGDVLQGFPVLVLDERAYGREQHVEAALFHDRRRRPTIQ